MFVKVLFALVTESQFTMRLLLLIKHYLYYLSSVRVVLNVVQKLYNVGQVLRFHQIIAKKYLCFHSLFKVSSSFSLSYRRSLQLIIVSLLRVIYWIKWLVINSWRLVVNSWRLVINSWRLVVNSLRLVVNSWRLSLLNISWNRCLVFITANDFFTHCLNEIIIDEVLSNLVDQVLSTLIAAYS